MSLTRIPFGGLWIAPQLTYYILSIRGRHDMLLDMFESYETELNHKAVIVEWGSEKKGGEGETG